MRELLLSMLIALTLTACSQPAPYVRPDVLGNLHKYSNNCIDFNTYNEYVNLGERDINIIYRYVSGYCTTATWLKSNNVKFDSLAEANRYEDKVNKAMVDRRIAIIKEQQARNASYLEIHDSVFSEEFEQ